MMLLRWPSDCERGCLRWVWESVGDDDTNGQPGTGARRWTDVHHRHCDGGPQCRLQNLATTPDGKHVERGPQGYDPRTQVGPDCYEKGRRCQGCPRRLR